MSLSLDPKQICSYTKPKMMWPLKIRPHMMYQAFKDEVCQTRPSAKRLLMPIMNSILESPNVWHSEDFTELWRQFTALYKRCCCNRFEVWSSRGRQSWTRPSRMRPRGRQCWTRPSRMRPPMLEKAEPQWVQTMNPNFLRFQSSVRLIPVGWG